MLRPRQPSTVEPAHLSHEDILVREEAAVRRRRLRRWLGAILGLMLAVAVWFGARPALHAVKAWQARRLAAEAQRLMDKDQWLDARQKISDANALWPLEPEVARVTALFLNRTGNFHQAITYWKRLATLSLLTPQDERDFASADLGLDDLDAAETLLRRAWPKDTPGTPADWLLAMQAALRRQHPADAASLARRLLADPAATERTRLRAAAALLSTDNSAEAHKLGWQSIEAVAAGNKSPESLDALFSLARWVVSLPPGQAAKDGFPPISDLIARIDAHPLAKAQHHLATLDLRAAKDPARRAEFVQEAVSRYGDTRNDADLAALTAWLYNKGEYDKVLALLPPERASGDRALFLQRLDTLGALGRWTEIRAAIQGRAFPLEPMIAQMYLARCAGQLGETAVRDTCWEAALDAAGTDTAKLVTVGQYAEKNGAVAIADKALRAAVAAAPDSREAAEAFFRLLESTGQTHELREALIAFSAHHPQDRALRNDIAYFDALLNVDVPAALATARELTEAEPNSLPHRVTLALAELRLGNGLAAMDTFRGLTLPDVSALQPRQQAVYAATLWKTSYEHEARTVVRAIVPERLLPEERELIRPISDKPEP